MSDDSHTPGNDRDEANAASESVELTFGECEGLCGRMVERIGWDRYCFDCQDEMREEDRERAARLTEEDEYLYGC